MNLSMQCTNEIGVTLLIVGFVVLLVVLVLSHPRRL